MSSIDYVADVAYKLVRKYKTRNPYEICKELGVRIMPSPCGCEKNGTVCGFVA